MNVIQGKLSLNLLSNSSLMGPTLGNTHGSQTFTSSGTFTVPSNVTRIFVMACGGGGGGGTGTTYYNGGAGASGYYMIGVYSVTPGTQYSVVIGAGGAGGAGGNYNNGSVGGNTSVGSLLTAPGGFYGYYNMDSDGSAGNSLNGSASGAAYGNFSPGHAASSHYIISPVNVGGSSIAGTGGAGGLKGSPSAGGNASGYGAGGGGGGKGSSYYAGGNGSSGIVCFYW